METIEPVTVMRFLLFLDGSCEGCSFFRFCVWYAAPFAAIVLVQLKSILKEHVALERSSWSIKTVCNQLL